ncbi:UNVERIFIED_CONTAM: hypothetical protein FKN15_055828 [Acipenser sinensis]
MYKTELKHVHFLLYLGHQGSDQVALISAYVKWKKHLFSKTCLGLDQIPIEMNGVTLSTIPSTIPIEMIGVTLSTIPSTIPIEMNGVTLSTIPSTISVEMNGKPLYNPY